MLNRKTFFIREHIGFLKLSDTYDILDPETQEQLGIAKEKPGLLVHLLRLVINKRMLPTQLFVYEGADFEKEDKMVFVLKRGFNFLKPKVEICDKQGKVAGTLVSKLLSIGGAFQVKDANDQEIAAVKGDWKGWNFKITDKAGQELGSVTKKWAGMGKELFTTADNYIISLENQPNPGTAILLLSAGLAIDTLFKEKN
jgi:uncharacterized protein YxjI